MNGGNRGPVLGAVVALVALISMLVAGIVITGKLDDNSTPLLVTILGLVAATIPSILALLKVQDVQHDIRNGVMEERVRRGSQRALTETLGEKPIVLQGDTIAESLVKMLEERANERNEHDG